ncbi:MAG TPA: hypothetical protein VJV78_10060 [Polyangiales bacterium]|nr:hypothetical protein [Polyangiales bacterium]
MPRHHAFFFILALACAEASSASAESLWLVTRVDVGEPKPQELNASRKLGQLLRARGLDVLDGASAASEFERKHSRTPHDLPPEEIAKLDAQLRKLADDLASENLPQAQQSLGEMGMLSPDIRDQLNHETQRARRRFHICLLAAHLISKEGSKAEASEQVLKCARDFPGLEPEQSPYLPESIRAFFAHVHQELENVRPSTVHVEVENSGDPGCRARLNGIDRGPTPATIEEVRTERVRIQVDCGKQDGRIYDVALSPGDNSFRIDPELDRAVQTQPALGLRYADAQAAANNRMLHSLRLARAVGASHVLSIWNGELHHIDVESRRDTTVGRLSFPLEELVDSVMAPTEPGPPNNAQVLAPASSNSESSPFATLGWITSGAALLAGGGLIIAWQVREGAVEDFNDDGPDGCMSPFSRTDPPHCADKLKSADATETAMWVLGFTGIGLATLAATFFILDAESGKPETHARQGCGMGPGDLGIACRVSF